MLLATLSVILTRSTSLTSVVTLFALGGALGANFNAAVIYFFNPYATLSVDQQDRLRYLIRYVVTMLDFSV